MIGITAITTKKIRNGASITQPATVESLFCLINHPLYLDRDNSQWVARTTHWELLYFSYFSATSYPACCAADATDDMYFANASATFLPDAISAPI